MELYVVQTSSFLTRTFELRTWDFQNSASSDLGVHIERYQMLYLYPLAISISESLPVFGLVLICISV